MCAHLAHVVQIAAGRTLTEFKGHMELKAVSFRCEAFLLIVAIYNLSYVNAFEQYGLARTVYIHQICLYIWGFLRQ
jgi:hypothetical protein